MINKRIKCGLLALLVGSEMMFAVENWPSVIRPTINSTQKFDIVKYGASAKSKNNTKAIQMALDACKEAGGGTVVVPADTFLCGPIVMSSNTNLHLSKGAVLEALPYGRGNGIDKDTYPNKGKENEYENFIISDGTSSKPAENLMISGEGSIYGNGAAWWAAFDSLKAAGTKMKRGCLVRFSHSRYIEIKDVTLKDAPGVHITIGNGGNSSNATINHIKIDTKVPSHNTDGIDTWAQNVDILNSYISCGDDNVAMDKGSKYIRIKNCKFGYGHGTSVGSFTSGVCHVLVDSCTYDKTDNGIRLKSSFDRGGGESDFVFSNLTMNEVKNPVYIDSYYTGKPKTPDEAVAVQKPLSETTPDFKDVLIRNVISKGTPKKNAVFIYGRPEQHVKNITFDHVSISAPKGMIINFADNVNFINGCDIVTETVIEQTYDATITGKPNK